MTSNLTLTRSKFASVRDSCSQKDALVKRVASEHFDQVSSSRSAIVTSHQFLLSNGDVVPQEPHLRHIFEKRCESDMITVEQDSERLTNLQALAKVGSPFSYFWSSAELGQLFAFL